MVYIFDAQIALTIYLAAALGFWISLKVGCTSWFIYRRQLMTPRTFTFIGDDYPRVWPIPEPHPVLMASGPTNRYTENTLEGSAEWAAMSPGDGLIYLGEHHRPFGLSMFHQLRCLSILQDEIVRIETSIEDTTPSDLSRHCLNYLRQMVLCRSDVTLEPVRGDSFGNAEVRPDIEVCNDWAAVYDEVTENQNAYRRWHESRTLRGF